MIDVEPLIESELQRMTPRTQLRSNWADVVERSESIKIERPPSADTVRRSAPRRARSSRKRPLLVGFAVLVVALVPVGALGVVKNDPWWFLRFPGVLGEGPAKGSKVVVLKEGSWDGQGWALTAYRSVAGHLCYQLTEVTASGAPSQEGSGGCTSTIGSIVQTPHGGHRRQTISLMGGTTLNFIRYIVGPVIATASEVRVTLTNGTVITTRTFPVPKALGMPIRFYAAQLPLPNTKGESCPRGIAAFEQTRPSRLVALDSGGKVVATLDIPYGPSLQFNCLPHRNHFVPPPELTGKSFTRIGQVTGPYGARATIAISAVIGMRGARALPNGSFKKFVRPSRCWRIDFSNGQSQGTCVPVAKRYEPELGPWIQHAGRDTFVFVNASPRIGAAIARVDLQLANGQTLSKTPVDGVVVFAVPKDALSTKKSQRGWLIAYDKAGNVLVQDNAFGHVRFKRQAVYYRSCPPGSSCYS